MGNFGFRYTRSSCCYSSKAGTRTSTWEAALHTVTECQWVIWSLLSCLPNQPSITPLSAALQENTAAAHMHITHSSVHTHTHTQLFICPRLSLQHVFIHTQARVQKLQKLPRYFCFCCCLSLCRSHTRAHTHTKVNTHSPSLALSKGTVGACCGGDIKHMEAKYPVWARAHWHNTAATLFDERPAEI